MIEELKAVFNKAERLNADEQLAIAKMIEDEIEWDKTFQKTQSQLSFLAEEVLHEYKSGKTKNEDW